MEDLKHFYSDNNFLSYRKYGTGAISVICLHGMASSKASFEDLISCFDNSQFTFYAFDLKGFGYSSVPYDNKYSVYDNAAIISQFINQEIRDNYVLIGHSFGGGVVLTLNACDLLLKKPLSEVLIDCACYDLSNGLPPFIKLLRFGIASRLGFMLTTAHFKAKKALKNIILSENLTDEIINRYTESLKGRHKFYSFTATARQIVPQNIEKTFANYDLIDVPALIIWGNEDSILPKEHGMKLNGQIKNSTFVLIESCGHIPQEEQPLKTSEAINNFLKSTLKQVF